jgi:hypothetical protein
MMGKATAAMITPRFEPDCEGAGVVEGAGGSGGGAVVVLGEVEGGDVVLVGGGRDVVVVGLIDSTVSPATHVGALLGLGTGGLAPSVTTLTPMEVED